MVVELAQLDHRVRAVVAHWVLLLLPFLRTAKIELFLINFYTFISHLNFFVRFSIYVLQAATMCIL